MDSHNIQDLDFSEFGSNSGYIKDLYELYLKDSKSVPSDWAEYFSRFSNGGGTQASVTNGQSYTNGSANYQSAGQQESQAVDAVLQEKIYRMVSAFRNRGHLKANINPLSQGVAKIPSSDDINIDYYGFAESDLGKTFPCAGFKGAEQLPLSELIRDIEDAYCSYIGFEIGHLFSQEERLWLQLKIEQRLEHGHYKLSTEQKLEHLKKIVEAEAFEAELHKKFIGQKRFSLQGGETLIPLIYTVLEEAGTKGIKEAVLGMAHRGRLNVLRNVLGKPLNEIFSEFLDDNLFSVLGSGDVKYHMGFEGPFVNSKGDKIKLSLAPNPSHLEFVYPVVEGMVRAKQDLDYDRDRGSVLSVILHGDAAFIGQGVVTETLNMAGVRSFHNGGTIHIVINNQVGFTTNPEDSRTSVYCTDFAKAIQAPIFHINGDSVDAACWAAATAVEFSKTFGRDVVLDLYCYRKYGHNEGDDPSFTQPLLYAGIKDKPAVSTIYAEHLKAEGLINDQDLQKMFSDYSEYFANSNKPSSARGRILGEACPTHGRIKEKPPVTCVSDERLREIANTLINYPENFTVHPKLSKILEKRVSSLDESQAIDWGFAEGLAFGSLVQEGINVRLTGQDCGRGTFSQRHLMLIDNDTAVPYFPYTQLKNKYKARFEVYNSTLSESSVLGYEFGYSTVAKERSLVLWEAQFGDFVNGAQVIIDQFISSSEQKWSQHSAVTLLLPHGYEGQGPEHSSARIERILQLCADGNMTVALPSCAAQHFHLLRKHALTKICRPLVVFTPKSLLRATHANADREDLVSGQFNPIIVDESTNKTKHVVFLAGKVYYDVKKKLEDIKAKNVMVIRVEQLYPLAEAEIKKALKGIEAKNYIWLQEEPKNMGSWTYIESQLRELVGSDVQYVGRVASASTATGSGKSHVKETNRFLKQLEDIIN